MQAHPCSSHSPAEASIHRPMEAPWKPKAAAPQFVPNQRLSFCPTQPSSPCPCRLVSSRDSGGEALSMGKCLAPESTNIIRASRTKKSFDHIDQLLWNLCTNSSLGDHFWPLLGGGGGNTWRGAPMGSGSALISLREGLCRWTQADGPARHA